MRRRLIVGLLLTVLAMLVPGPPAGAHSGYWKVADTAGNGLRVRTGPGGTYRILEVMPRGRIVKAYGHRGNWMKLKDTATGVIGWSSLTYLVVYTGTGSGSGGGSTGGGAICLTNYWNEYLCSSDNVGNAIRYWAAYYGIGWYWMAAVASCESHFQIYAVNEQGSGASGLFQFMPQTFWAWGGVDLWDPWDQSRITAKMWNAGEARQFYCAILVGYA